MPASLATAVAWTLRSQLSSRGRQRARRLADSLLSPLGSISGAARPSSQVALTFDDGPDPEVTPRLLDLLAERGRTATFFLLTDRVASQQALVRRMAEEGHEVALHSDRHERLTEVPGRELRRRLEDARDLLQQASGQPVRLFRPPFGAQSLATYLSARCCGLEVVVWGPYAADWVDGSEDAVAARGLRDMRGGDVLLLHDGLVLPAGEAPPRFDRIKTFSLILDGMQDRGLEPTTVGTLTASAGTRRTAWFRP